MPRYWNPKYTTKVQSDKYRNRLERMGVLKEWDTYFEANPGNNPSQFWNDRRNGGGFNAPVPSPQIPPATSLSDSTISSVGGGSNGIQYATAPNGLQVKITDRMQKVLAANAQAAQATEERFLNQQSPFGATNDDALKGDANWTDVSVDTRKSILSNPSFYANNEIVKYPKWMQQQILADPAFDWKQLPAWQKTYFEASSNPALMGAAQGTILGLGNPGGTLTGAVLGWAAGKSGYDQTKEFWQQDNALAGGFGLMNWLAQQAEKTIGMGAQIANAALDPNRNVTDVLNKESWNAGAITFEVLAPAWQEAIKGNGKLDWLDALKVVPSAYILERMGEVIAHPEKFKGNEIYLGANLPVKLDQSWIERIDQARKEIKAGRPYLEVMAEVQTGVLAQVGDMAGQAIADPLNYLPKIETKVGTAIAEAGGNKVAAESLRTSEGLAEAGRRYKTLVQTGEALKIDPSFKTDQMGWFSRMVAGVNKAGEVKVGSLLPTETGLLEPVKNQTGFVQDMITQTPHSRAQTGANLFYENVSTLLSTFDDPHEAGKYLKALANNDMDTWAGLGTRFAESPEFYTVLPALKEFNAGELDGIIQAWDMTQANRDALTRIADVLGENPSSLLDDLAARGTAQQDFERMVQRLQDSQAPEAKALLDDIQAGRFTADTLKQIVDVFTGEGALPWHPGQWKATMLDRLGTHFDEWVTKRLMLDKSPEAVSAFYRTAALMKQAQSILLLGGSPNYAIQNGLSNMVHRAVSGVFGFLTPGQIDGFMERLGVAPARFEEGIGIGGQVEQAAGTSRVKVDAMTEALRGKGPLTTAKDALAKLSRGMPMSKLSSWFEKTEGRQAFAIAMKDFWSQSWRRGVGFSRMSPELVKVISDMGVNPERIYAAIEAGMNQNEIEKALYGRYEGVQARSLIHDAAQKTGLSANGAAQMLDKIGVLDTLDTFLKGQTTSDGVRSAFARADRIAQDAIDVQTGEDLKAMAESVKQRVGLEGASAALDVVQKAHGAYTDTWMDHYFRFGEVMNDLNLLDDPAMRSKAIDLNYELSDNEFRRVNARSAANYKGIFDAWGLSAHPDALDVLRSIGESDLAMKTAYNKMREIRKGFFEKYRDDFDNPARFDEWKANQKTIDKLFADAFTTKHAAEEKMGASLGKIYENLYGPAAGEAAHVWWDDVVAFNDEIVTRERDFRSSLEGMTKDQREIAKQEFYSKTKMGMIAELDRINGEGIARLERTIKGGGSASTPTAPPPSTEPPAPTIQNNVREGKPTRAEEINALIQQAEQRKAVEAKEQADRVSAVWDTAEGFWGRGANYSREIFQDKFALLGALRKPEYGGIEDLTGLNDPRVTPDLVQSVLETRANAKEATAINNAQHAFTTANDIPYSGPKIHDDTSLLRAISEHGGLDKTLAADLTGEKRPKSAPGVFTNKGHGIDDMARMLADDGYPIDLNDPSDPGGIRQTTELINRARNGEKIFPAGHDYNKALDAAEKAFIDSFDLQNVDEQPFDMPLWQTDFSNTIQRGDLSHLYELIGNFPERLAETLTPDGETFRDFMSRMADDTAARVEADQRAQAVAEHATQAQASVLEEQARAQATTTRQLLQEKFQHVFGLTEEQTHTYMELSDSVARWYAKMTGESADAFYSRYYNDVVESSPLRPSDTSPKLQGNLGEEVLYQIEPVNRKMSPQEVENYARALVRAGADELRRAVTGETTKADRIALLDAAHTLDASMAEQVARQTKDILFQEGKAQEAKGAVTFDQDGIKATIHAFEAKDFSTLIHENGHVFRRVLKDVAERTNNPRILQDLDTIERWAGVKDGKWTRAHEEKFAKGFERYVTEGKAPTPKLARAFEMFKGWMLEIYKTISGSSLNVKITDDVRGVFDRMLGKDLSPIDLAGGDRRQTMFQQLRQAWDGLDPTTRTDTMRWVMEKTLVDPLSGLETSFAKALEGQKPAGWVEAYSDLNALKYLNDTFGHESGDAAIARLGSVALDEVEKAGGRAFRDGGDEMSYWFPNEDAARNALAAIDERFHREIIDIRGQRYKGFSISYGIGETKEIADAAMYADKQRRIALGQRAERGGAPTSIEAVDAVKRMNEAALPQEFKKYTDGSGVKHWEVSEQDYLEERFSREIKRAQYNFEGWTKTLEELRGKNPKADNKNTREAEFNIKFWEKQANLKEPNPGNIDSWRREYIDLTKKAISKGEPVPQAVINQYPEFTKAQDARARYEKGRHTSFGNRSIAVNDSMQAERGYKVKRQDGKPIAPEQIKHIRDVTDEVSSVIGDLKDLFTASDLTIAHTNGKHPFLSGAGGMYHPSDRTVSIGIIGTQAGAHELAHWLDIEAGDQARAETRWYTKGNERKTTTSLAEADGKYSTLIDQARRSMLDHRMAEKIAKGQATIEAAQDLKYRLGPYWNEPREVFARLMEEFIATKLGDGRHESTDSPQFYYQTPGWWSKGDFDRLSPLVESEINRRLEILRAKVAPTEKTSPLSDASTLFQTADQPFGSYDAASQFMPHSEAMDQGWGQYVRPLLDAMQEGALNQVSERPLDGAMRDVSPEGQAMLRQYMKQVQNEMGSTKLATVRWGENQRDFALLNYGKQYGADRLGQTIYPYELYPTRSLVTWGARGLDMPALFSNYARLKMQQDRYERDIPERLRGKIKISAPWLPEWMGDSMYIDPLQNLWFPEQVLKPFERMQQDANQQQIEAERILQQWAADGQTTDAEAAQAAQSRSGNLYERALAQAKINRESEIANPMDFFNTMFGPAWYLSTPLNLAGIKSPWSKGDPNQVTPTPLGNTSRAIDTVTNGTWAEPIGNLIGILGKVEDWGRSKVGLPQGGEYGEYYTKRWIANMVVEGKITSEQAEIAMIDKSGPIWNEAQQRVNMELAMRVPLMGTLYAGLHGGVKAAAQAFLPSLFGSGLLPQGELRYRGLKQEWNEAWARADAGDMNAVNHFFTEHPEYQAYLAKGKSDDELLKSFLIGQIWDGYMSLGATNQRQARAEMGTLFEQAFLNKETRSYDTLDIQTLTQWAQLLNKQVPASVTPTTSPSVPLPTPNERGQAGEGRTNLNLYSPAVTAVTDKFFTERMQKFPNYYALQQQYYALASEADRSKFLLTNPEYAGYRAWRDSWYKRFPQYKPIFNGDAFDRVDTSTWPPMLEDFVRNYAMTGHAMPSGATKALQQVWINEGQPMGDFKTWLNSTVVPGMLYGSP